ncbi:MAG: hypothetical protein Q7R41_10245, partial [Phycisphaerales bacterium]|nr:hypothetical protein [Phycisphaerales bacterium]
AVGSIVAWGDTYSGQTNVPTPTTSFIAVAAGSYHSLGLRTDGSIVAWGDNSAGETNIPAPNTGFIAVAAGGLHSLGLKANGSIVAWGYNSSGQTNVPAPNAGFVAIDAGFSHSLGVKTDGSIVAWGCGQQSFNYGQCDVPAPNTGFVAVAAGEDHSLGLRADGSIVAWGRNTSGQTDVPTPNKGFIAVAAGGDHNLGLKVDGAIEPCAPPVIDGTPCDGGNVCTIGETCQGGVCTGGAPPDCSAAGDQCTVASCDPNGTDGNCSILTPVADGTPCDDGRACTDDACGAGTCTSTPSPAGSPCGDPRDSACDNPDTCDGTGTCRANLEPAGTVCRPTEGPCDIEETCDGKSPDCPPDLFEPDTTECRPTQGECDVAELCGGAGPDCPPDELAPARSACGDPTDSDCDNPDTCDGLGTCAQNLKPSFTVCRTAAGACDIAEFCTGANRDCPLEAFAPDGTACADDGNECTSDTCESGQCTHPSRPPGAPCGDSRDSACDHTDTCDGSGTCQPNLQPDGSSCSDGLFCTGQEVCASGACTDAPDPCADAGHCDEGSDRCLECIADDECADSDACIVDACSAGHCFHSPDPRCRLTARLDIKPGSCPNPVNPGSKGVVPVAIVGSAFFDVTEIERDSLRLGRADGVGGTITPLSGPRGPGVVIEDVATPFVGEPCGCHELDTDGIDDLVLKFSTPDAARAFQLDSWVPGSAIELTLTGSLRNGASFEATDCIRLPGSHALSRTVRTTRMPK